MPAAFLDNRWQPGQSGNPNGRPKKRSLFVALKEELDKQLPDEPERTRLDLVAQTVVDRVLSDRPDALDWFREMNDRLYGKPQATTTVNVIDHAALARSAVKAVAQLHGFTELQAVLYLAPLADQIPGLVDVSNEIQAAAALALSAPVIDLEPAKADPDVTE